MNDFSRIRTPVRPTRNCPEKLAISFRPVAIDFINAARGYRLKILGIDAFKLTDSATEPLLEHSIDLSSEPGISDTWEVAEGFIRQYTALGLHFEVVVEGTG